MSAPPQAQMVVYTIRLQGHTDVDIRGEAGIGLLYMALGVAARESFLRLRPVEVLENGMPYRCVYVTMPYT